MMKTIRKIIDNVEIWDIKIVQICLGLASSYISIKLKSFKKTMNTFIYTLYTCTRTFSFLKRLIHQTLSTKIKYEILPKPYKNGP